MADIYSQDEQERRMAWQAGCEAVATTAIAGLRRSQAAGLLSYTRRAQETPQAELLPYLPGQGCSEGFDGNWNDWRRRVGR